MTSELKNLQWVADLLPDEVIPKHMHEGVGYYLDEKLVLILVESSKTTVYKGVAYPFEIWNGCFFPIEKIKQDAVYKNFMSLENHPALKNSLYLPTETEDFEEQVKLLIREIKKRNPLFGLFLKIKKPTPSVDQPDVTDLSKPTLFSEEPQVKKNHVQKKKPASKPSKGNKKPENAFLLTVLKKKNK